MTDLDDHLTRFEAHYNRIKHLDQTDEWKTASAEFMASRRAFDVLIAPDTLSALPVTPFEPADYLSDGKRPVRMGEHQ